MKATKDFIETIGRFLETERSEDPAFNEKCARHPEKTVEGCCNFILHEVYKQGGGGYTDAEIFGMARHFYDEEGLKDPGELRASMGKVVTNHHVEISDEEKAELKARALRDFEKEIRAKAAADARAQAEAEKARRRKKEEERRARLEALEARQLSLFD